METIALAAVATSAGLDANAAWNLAEQIVAEGLTGRAAFDAVHARARHSDEGPGAARLP